MMQVTRTLLVDDNAGFRQAYRDAAMDSGANGYVTKGSLFEELLPAIRGAFGVSGKE
jgi:DNA-binding NarL/FixJ family response regulator